MQWLILFSPTQKRNFQEAFFLSHSKMSGQHVTCKSKSRPCRSLSPSMQRNRASSLRSAHAAVGQAPRGSLAHRMVDNAHVRGPYVRPHVPTSKRQTSCAHVDEWQGDITLAPRQHAATPLTRSPWCSAARPVRRASPKRTTSPRAPVSSCLHKFRLR
jgi:hypothetical protein